MTFLQKLRKLAPQIEELASHYGASRIRLFGSVAREKDSSSSDIDFLVDFPSGYDVFTQRLPLARALSELTGRKADVVLTHELNPYIEKQILQEALEL